MKNPFHYYRPDGSDTAYRVKAGQNPFNGERFKRISYSKAKAYWIVDLVSGKWIE